LSSQGGKLIRREAPNGSDYFEITESATGTGNAILAASQREAAMGRRTKYCPRAVLL